MKMMAHLKAMLNIQEMDKIILTLNTPEYIKMRMQFVNKGGMGS
jgi:hypothetical protein